VKHWSISTWADEQEPGHGTLAYVNFPQRQLPLIRRAIALMASVWLRRLSGKQRNTDVRHSG
jgi:hypothetical protein